ncbi:MAG: caspase family protein [Caldilineaceae bacterium]|nr:caspase family protein [Caldilineaceae bacterium]
MPQRPLFALLIGINRYLSPAVPDLGGCVNDVAALSTWLQQAGAMPAETISILTDEAATAAALRQAWRDRLLAPLQAWAAAHPNMGSAEQPAVLFYFSGHGSQARTVHKATGFDETLVPHDSRTPGVYDVKDWEIGAWLAELAPYTSNVTVILDCCHSGSGVRNLQKLITEVRACPPDERPQPRPATAPAAKRGFYDQSQQTGHLNHVLLAACRNDEKAREGVLGTPPQRHGRFTYWLLDVLAQRPPHQPLTYRDLYDQVRHRLQTAHDQEPSQRQTPQCEGDRDRLFLGDLRMGPRRWLTVIGERDGLIWVDGGFAQGLSVGTVIHLYAQDVDLKVVPLPTPVVSLQVDVVESVQSGCVRLPQTLPTPIPLGARALVHRYGVGAQRIKVALAVEEGLFLKTLRARLLMPDIYPQIELALPHEEAPFRLSRADEFLYLRWGDQQQHEQVYNLRQLNPYRRPLEANDLDPVARDLRHWVAQARVGAIASEAGSELVANLAVTLARLHVPDSGELQLLPLRQDEEGYTLVPVDTPFVLSITNRYRKPLYLTVLELGYRGDVTRVYPQVAGANEAVGVGKTLQIGYTREVAFQLIARLPAHLSTVEETWKIMVTTEEAAFDALLQGELASTQPDRPVTRSGQPAPAAPAATPASAGLRGYQWGSDIEAADQWGTVEVRIRVRRALR